MIFFSLWQAQILQPHQCFVFVYIISNIRNHFAKMKGNERKKNEACVCCTLCFAWWWAVWICKSEKLRGMDLKICKLSLCLCPYQCVKCFLNLDGAILESDVFTVPLSNCKVFWKLKGIYWKVMSSPIHCQILKCFLNIEGAILESDVLTVPLSNGKVLPKHWWGSIGKWCLHCLLSMCFENWRGYIGKLSLHRSAVNMLKGFW